MFNQSDNEEGEFFLRQQAQQAAIDRQVMELTEFKVSIDRMMDTLDPDQAWTLYRIMELIGRNNRYDVAHFFAGQLSMLLRRVHNTCANCGNINHSTAEHVLSKMEEAAERELAVNPSDEEDSFILGIEDEFLNADGMRNKYRVRWHEKAGETEGDERVVCIDCEVEFKDIDYRISQGITCPGCQAKKVFDSGETNS